MLDDPLENKRLLELVGTERRKKVIRIACRMTGREALEQVLL